MAPQTVFYILAGCVAVAALVFVVMIVVTALRPPQLPELDVDPPPPLERMIRALTPVPFAPATAGGAFEQARAPSPPMRPSSPRVVPATPQVAPSIAPASPTPIARTAAPPARIAPPGVAPTPSATTTAPPFAAPSAPVSATPSAPPSASIAPPSARTTAKPAAKALAAPFSGYVLPSAARRGAPAVTAAPIPSTLRIDRSREGARLPVYPERRARWLLRIVLGMFVASLLAAGAVVAYPALLDPLCDDYEWFGAEASQVVREHAQNARAWIVELIDRF